MKYDKPHFIIKNNLQKSAQTGIYFSDIVTVDVLKDVCYKITGIKDDFTYQYVDNQYQDEFLKPTYNTGRLAILRYNKDAIYISFSENNIRGRNSSVQSVPTAFNMFYSNKHPNKKLYYYFLNVDEGNPETDYLILMYRLMHTIGFHFLNPDRVLAQKISPFISVEDIMFFRRINSGRNQSNNSTYLTKSSSNSIDIYGKTYGANKYETSMICYAVSFLAHQHQHVNLFEVLENDLRELPKPSLDVLAQMGNINVIPTDIRLEKDVFESNNSLRSPRYLFNLFKRVGEKRCAFCDCEIPEIIEGAHIWPVATIKKEPGITFDEKLYHATNGDNGIWLCENHHKLFDENFITIDTKGTISYKNNIDKRYWKYLEQITPYRALSDSLISDDFIYYVRRRNMAF